MKKIAKFRTKEHPNCWVLTNFTMEQVERKMEYYEKIIKEFRKVFKTSFKIDSIHLDQDHKYCCKLCDYFEEHDEKPKGTIGGCSYINDWLHNENNAVDRKSVV